MFVYRDPVFGSIEFEDFEKKIFVLPEVERLKFIKQNSALYLIFPGAHHTRFEHTLGVCHLSTKIFDSIIERHDLVSEGERRVLDKWRKEMRIAALFHDIGHGPLSHLYEIMLNRNGINTENLPSIFVDSKNSEKPVIEKNLKIHEWLSCFKILNCSEIRNYFHDKTDIEKISHLAVGDYRNYETETDFFWVYEIIASEFDADRLEYLTRDSHFTGANFGQIDLLRIIDSGFIIPPKGNRLFIDFHKGLASVECGLITRAQMYPHVYLHPTARAVTAMLLRSFDNIYEKENDKKTFIRETSQMVDYEFMLFSRQKEKDLELSFTKRVMFRDIYKKIVGKYRYINRTILHPEVREELEYISNKKDKYEILKLCENKFEELYIEYRSGRKSKFPILLDIPHIPPLEELKSKISMPNMDAKNISEVSKLASTLKETVRENWNMFLFHDPNDLQYPNEIDEFIEKYFTLNGSGQGADVIKNVIKNWKSEKKTRDLG